MAFHKSFFVTGYSNQVIMPKDKTDSISISVQESIESMVVTRFSAFESKLNSLADSMTRMSDSLHKRSS